MILDSCYSASDSTLEPEDTLVLSRGINLPDDYFILPTVDQDILSASRDNSVEPDFEPSRFTSHVLLSGCRLTQTSKEEAGRGRFTTTLLKVLETDGTDKLTYEQLIDRLDVLPECVVCLSFWIQKDLAHHSSIL